MTPRIEFKFFTPIKESEIPLQSSDKRQSSVRSLRFWPEFELAVRQVADGNALPNAPLRLDLDDFKSETKKFKRPMPTVLMAMRKLLVALQVEQKVEVVRRGNHIIVNQGKNLTAKHTGGPRRGSRR